MRKVYKIEISTRVNLFLSNDGFRFTIQDKPPKDFQPFSCWESSWMVYSPDNIIEKVNVLLDSFPEHLKTQTLFQSIHFN
jgi:hypothetical protein